MNTLIQLVGLAPEHRDVITTGGQIVLAFLGLMTVLVTYFLERLRREVKKGRDGQEETAENARLAAERSKPTGNGYALRTEQSLARIEARLDRIDRRVESNTNRLNAHIDKENTA